jgi:hypothetical protein
MYNVTRVVGGGLGPSPVHQPDEVPDTSWSLLSRNALDVVLISPVSAEIQAGVEDAFGPGFWIFTRAGSGNSGECDKWAPFGVKSVSDDHYTNFCCGVPHEYPNS